MAYFINGINYHFKDVQKNRLKFFNKISVDINNCVCMHVVHKDKVIKADESLRGISMTDYNKAVEVDGLYTDKKGLYLFLLVADCLPIIIYDPKKEALALVHAGWEGIDLEIAAKAVEKFKSVFKSNTFDIVVAIGPRVEGSSFIKKNPSQKNDPRWKQFLKDMGDDNYQIDLVGFCKKQLINSGINVFNIIDSGVDTANDDRFFSHTRDVKNRISRQGRFACVVGLK